MHYYVRPSFDPQRADEIIGPLSLVQVNELIENGPVTRHWLVLALNKRLQVSVRGLARNEWYPITALPGVIGFAEEALPPSKDASAPIRTPAEGCLHVLTVWFFIGLGIIALVLAFIFAECALHPIY